MIRMILGTVGLLLVWVMSCPGGTQEKEHLLPKGHWPEKVIGRGETEESAKDVALREAVNAVNDFMQKQDPPLQSFVVTKEYVQKHLLADAGHAGAEIKIVLNGVNTPFKEWILTFRKDYNWWNDIVRRDQAAQRKFRIETRQTVASHLVIAASLLLLTSFGYVRLDQYTKHRHTTWLRIAGIGTASVLLAGCWLILQRG